MLPWKSITYYIYSCVRVRARVCVASVIQYAKCMRRIIFHLWPAWLYHLFLHYLINGTIFGGGGGGKVKKKKYVVCLINKF
jgi:hypothetical protein